MTHDPPNQASQTHSAAGLLPTSADLISAFQHAERAGSCTVASIAATLASHHLRQWAAEDASRNATSPQTIATAKRAIDELNAARIAMVEQLDLWAARSLPAAQSAPLHTETLGSVIDRLAIAWVRYHQLLEHSDPDARSIARQALRQMSELAGAYDDLVRDIDNRIRRVPTWLPLKHYRTQP